MATLPGHKWVIEGRSEVEKAFVYKCTRCPARTLSGHALPSPYDKDCK